MRRQKGKNKTNSIRTPRESGTPSLSLCMIVKNEADRLKECLEPLQSLVEEIVVVDTGSTDDTREIARRMGAKVFEFPWIDDFSAARNESIRRAAGQFILWLDADDRMEPGEVEKLKQIRMRLDPRHPKAYYFLVESANPVEGVRTFQQLRLFPKKPGIRFVGRIHEQVNFSLQRLGIPLENLPIRIRHTGYENWSAIQGKYERNWRILQEDLAKDQENIIHLYYGARTLSGMNRYPEAIVLIKKIIDNPVIRKNERTFYLHAATMLGDFYLNTHDYSAAQDLFQRLAKDYPDDPLVHYGLGESLFRAGNYDEACAPFCRSLDLPLEFSIFPINRDKLAYDQFHHLATCYQRLGLPDRARETWQVYVERYPEHGPTWELLGLLALEQGRLSEAADCFQEAVRRGVASDKLYANWGLCLRKLGDGPLAEQALHQALEINPNRLEAWINLGHLFYERKEHYKALEFFDQALTLDALLVDVRLFISDILAQTGEVEALVSSCDVLLKILGLDRDITIESLQELGELFYRIAGVLDQQGKAYLSMVALQVGFTLAPTQEILEQLVDKAKKLGKLAETLGRLEKDLAHLKKSPPLDFSSALPASALR